MTDMNDEGVQSSAKTLNGQVRQIGFMPQAKAPKSGRKPGKFQTAV
jgi:hypothetical protein